MPSLHQGAIFIGVFLIVTGGSTAFLTSNQSKLQAFSMCCVVLGAVMLILGLFWAMNGKRNPVPYNEEFSHDYSQVLFTPPPGSHFPESQSVFLHGTLQRRGVYGEDLDYPPMEPACFSPTIRGRPPHWDLEPPPPYEVAIKTTTSSTRLRRSYSDTHLLTEPLFGRSREISFEV
ncbi:uncharacterized protein si:dkeyp-51f12.2 [Triplophysa dalaica]|uniref:uncharacterized protein si:dkeyp-51f12.2 n=1 Tax=Triplophysa dalaica TaxID=1582913 RepID=UPI0024DF7E52|nr:uncharacterized protein si:dkeyp-51f12.2 [Triplophysa dalaica]